MKYLNELRNPIEITSLFFLPLLSCFADDALPFVQLEPYFVTGSHLPQDAALPPPSLTSITNNDLSLRGDHTPTEAFRKEPYAYGSTNTENDSNSGTGSAGANIHGMGNLSTLTLINGRRAGGNSAVGFQHGGFADLNLIPSSAIKEVQTTTDGTSVAYGSDASAGTVNVILYDDFIGNTLDLSYSITDENDAEETAVSFLHGQNLSASTNIVLQGSYYHRNPIQARDRERSESADRRAEGGLNQSSSSYPGNLMVNYAEYVLKDDINSPSTSSSSIDQNYRPRDPASDFYDYSQAAVAIPEVERKSFMANVVHKVSDSLAIWNEFLFTNSTFMNGLAPAPWLTYDFPGASYKPSLMNAIRMSPHLPGGIQPDSINLLSYRNFELGNLENLQEKRAFREVIGLKGEFNEWEWESAIAYINTQLDETWSGVVDQRLLENQILDGSFNPFARAYTAGQIPGTTNSYDNTTALSNSEASPVNHYNESYFSYDAKVFGPLFDTESGPIDLAYGVEFRNEAIDVQIDELFESGYNLGGQQRNSYAADRKATALFSEIKIPLFTNENRKLDASLSLRYENYQDQSESSGATNRYDALVYKCALQYQHNQFLTLRTSFGTTFRAPTLNESFGGDNNANPIYYDPLGYTPAGSRINTLIQSNSDLSPETSRNFNAGLVFSPAPSSGWQISLDYYRIESNDVIANGAQYFVDTNAAGQAAGFGTPGNFDPNAPYADQIYRNATTGALIGVDANWFNVAEVKTDGIDYATSYTLPTASGFWRAKLGLNQVLSYKVKASENTAYSSYLGKFVDPRAAGGNIIGRGSIPRYKAYIELMCQQNQLELGGRMNYIDSLNDNPAFTADGMTRQIESWTTFDLFVNYTWLTGSNGLLDNTKLSMGIDNVTDEPPPFAAGAFADGYDSSLYNLEGRRYRISLSVTF